MIILEGTHIQVEDRVNGFGNVHGQKPQMFGIGRKVQYEFEGGVWKASPSPNGR